MIKFGICTAPKNASTLASLGYDYIECGLASFAAMSDEEYEAAKEAILSSPIRMEAVNVFLPGSFQLTGDEADLSGIPAYLDKVLPRVAALGCKVAVFGSSGARNVPEGFPMEKAAEQLAEFLRIAGPACKKYGIRIAIEPLNTKESNIINSVKAGQTLAIASGDENVGCLADWYHVEMESEGVDGILSAREMLWHCHIANLNGRIYPKPDDDQQERYAAFFGALKSIGYDHRLSIEGKGDVETEGAAGLEALRKFCK